jgi:alcohol dehydrogenase (NADP+)
MPSIGLGTYQNGDKESIASAIVDSGYRHIDCAEHYLNENVVGEALQIAFSKGIKREELYIVSKLWVT